MLGPLSRPQGNSSEPTSMSHVAYVDNSTEIKSVPLDQNLGPIWEPRRTRETRTNFQPKVSKKPMGKFAKSGQTKSRKTQHRNILHRMGSARSLRKRTKMTSKKRELHLVLTRKIVSAGRTFANVCDKEEFGRLNIHFIQRNISANLGFQSVVLDGDSGGIPT